MTQVNTVKQSKLGIVGGLGPAATAYFYSMITDLTDAQYDQQHLEIVIYSKPQIPDRTSYILKKSNKSPVSEIIETANELVQMSAENIAIPCVTAHTFYDEIAQGVNVPVINVLAETASYLQEQGVRRVGIMATDGLIAGGALQRLLEANGIEVLIPQADEQAKIMQTIYAYKANCVEDTSSAINVAARMRASGAEVILLACTELSLLKRDVGLDASHIDMLEILARRAIERSGGKVIHEYKSFRIFR